MRDTFTELTEKAVKLSDVRLESAAYDSSGVKVKGPFTVTQKVCGPICVGEERFARLIISSLQFTPDGEKTYVLGSVVVPYDNGRGCQLLTETGVAYQRANGKQ